MLPGALSAAEQRRILRDALTVFVEPPNSTNHTAHLGPLGGALGGVPPGQGFIITAIDITEAGCV